MSTKRESIVADLTGKLRRTRGEIFRSLAEEILTHAENLVREENRLKSESGKPAENAFEPRTVLGVDPGSPEGSKAMVGVFSNGTLQRVLETHEILDIQSVLQFLNEKYKPAEYSEQVLKLMRFMERLNSASSLHIARRVDILQHTARVLMHDENLTDEEKEKFVLFFRTMLSFRHEILETLRAEEKAIAKWKDNP